MFFPLDEMIKHARLKFMHNYVHNRLPFSFNETWIFNHVRNPDRVLRNANDMYRYAPAHNFATVKSFPLFSFPQAWNEENIRKLNPSLNSYCKGLKASLLFSLSDCVINREDTTNTQHCFSINCLYCII
jgi:hypothetical protein